MNDNYYHILGLDNYSSIEEVKTAYRKLAKRYHPDKNPDKPQAEEQFKRLSLAYKTLTNPDKKETYDRQLQNRSTPVTSSPRYAKPQSYYSRRKREYTPTAWMFAKIFLILFTMSIVLIPLTLLYQSSVRYYERGLASYNEGNIPEALLNFNRAISQFGGRSTEAGIKAAEIYLYEYRNYTQTIYFVNRALEHAERQQDLAYLFFLRGTANYGERNGRQSLHDYQMADSLMYNQDSLQLKLGFLHSFELNDFRSGKSNFNYLIDKGIKLELAWFGKGWCQQSENQYQQAISSYTHVFSYNDSNALAYFYRAECFRSLNDSINACMDYQKALDLGFTLGEATILRYCYPDSLNSTDN